jgi:phosphate uptake regulator
MMQADPSGIPGYLELGEIVKRLERIADHAINIAEGVVFIEDAPPRCE